MPPDQDEMRPPDVPGDRHSWEPPPGEGDSIVEETEEVDPTTGQRVRRVVRRTRYVKRDIGKSLDDLPPDIRARVEQMMDRGQTSGTRSHTTIRIRDGSGPEQVYHSVEDMPPDVRRRYESLGSGEFPSAGSDTALRHVVIGGAAGALTGRAARESWFLGVFFAALLIGYGAAALVNQRAVFGMTDQRTDEEVTFRFSEGTAALVGLACVVAGGLLYAVYFWRVPMSPARRRRGLTTFLVVLLVGFFVGNYWPLLDAMLHDLQTL
ncbi:MAG TPA: hypothetical protein VM243_06540 [Phycisphaerae bacterium]|nr:hypothetical protein [Phycisphaerae bacterium]